jgi:hypothetical protein
MSRAWLCSNNHFWRFWGCRQEEGNCIWRAWLWKRCRQPNAAHLHPVSLVGPETRTKRTLTQRSSEPTARLSCSAVVSWPNRGGDPTAVARTCWTRPPLVRLVAWSTTLPQAARARGIRMIVSPATVRRCCHGLAVAVRGRGESTGAPDSGHPSRAAWRVAAHMDPRGPDSPARAAWKRRSHSYRVETREGAPPVGFGGSWTVRCTRPQGGMARHAALPPRGSDRASAETESNTDAPRWEAPCQGRAAAASSLSFLSRRGVRGYA